MISKAGIKYERILEVDDFVPIINKGNNIKKLLLQIEADGAVLAKILQTLKI